MEHLDRNYTSPSGPSEHTTWAEWAEHCFEHDPFDPEAESTCTVSEGLTLPVDPITEPV
jgi:hypothetical protein